MGHLCVVDDTGTERGAVREARRLGDRLTRLARVTTELVMADSVEAVTKIVVSQGADAAGATLASLALREGEDRLRLVGLRGGREGDERRWATFPMSLQNPVTDAVRTGERVIVTGEAAIAAALSRPRRHRARASARSSACRCTSAHAPSARSGCRSPGLREPRTPPSSSSSTSWPTPAPRRWSGSAPRRPPPSRAPSCVFLADASTELASSLDYQATLAKVAQLAVPTFADWCAIDVVEDGRLHRLAVAHVDPAKVQLAQRARGAVPRRPRRPERARGR